MSSYKIFLPQMLTYSIYKVYWGCWRCKSLTQFGSELLQLTLLMNQVFGGVYWPKTSATFHEIE